MLTLSISQVRQLAAVELRKRVAQNSGDLWIQLPLDDRDQIKAKLPELILAEPKYSSLLQFPSFTADLFFGILILQ